MKREIYYYLSTIFVFLIIRSNIATIPNGGENTVPNIKDNNDTAATISNVYDSKSFFPSVLDSTKSMATKTTTNRTSSSLIRTDKIAEDLEQGVKLLLRSLYLLFLFLPTLLLSPLAYGYPWFRMTVWFPLLRLTIAWSGAVSLI